MALTKFSWQWNGIRRAISGCYLETSYAVYADMDGGGELPFLRVNGFSIYADTASALSEALPATVQIEIGNGTYSYQINETILAGAYSPSGNRMPYYALLSSSESMDFPEETEFEITVMVTTANGGTLNFTEAAHCPMANSLNIPSEIVTGTATEFQLSSVVPADTSYQSAATLVWTPQAVGTFATQVYEDGYVDPYTKVREANDSFSSIFFAVANPDNLPSSLISTARVSFTTSYMSAAFTGGCVITELAETVKVTPSSTVDSSLIPEVTQVTMAASPADGIINGKYVHNKTTITFTPTIRFKYGDSLAYLNSDLGGNRYADSISTPANGVTPGEEYTRPDTGETVTADDTSIRGIIIRAVGRKWKLMSTDYPVTYQVLYYLPPRVNSLNVYRMAVSDIATDYQYNGVYYKKDDFGAYGMAEFHVGFSDLDGENQTSMTLQYGTHRINVTPDANGYGFVVFQANTAVSLNVNLVLYDNFMPYGVSATRKLSTASILIDYLSGGKGMAIGKAATEANALDIADGWTLFFYQAMVGAYNGDDPEDLVAWMHQVDSRLDYLENSIYAN